MKKLVLAAAMGLMFSHGAAAVTEQELFASADEIAAARRDGSVTATCKSSEGSLHITATPGQDTVIIKLFPNTGDALAGLGYLQPSPAGIMIVKTEGPKGRVIYSLNAATKILTALSITDVTQKFEMQCTY